MDSYVKGTDGSFENSIVITEVLLAHKCTYTAGETNKTYENGRSFSGFVCPLSGSAIYTPFCAESFTVRPGEIVYLPAMSRYVISAGDKGFTHYTVNFLVEGSGNAERERERERERSRLGALFGDSPVRISAENFDSFRNVFTKAVSTFGTNLFGSTLLVKAQVLELIHMFFAESARRNAAKGEYEAVLRAKNYIEEHFCEAVSAKELSRMCSMSETGLRRKFRECLGQPPLDYQTGLRIRKARELLLERKFNVGEVSRLVGFEDVNYFSRLFKKRVGVSPTEYGRMY